MRGWQRSDAGATWQIQLQLAGGHGFNVLDKARQGHRLWAGTDQGKLYTWFEPLANRTFSTEVVSVFPNPADGLVTFRGTDIASIQLFDLSGRAVEVTVPSATQRDVSGLAGGCYLAIIHKTDGAEATVKLMVCH